MVRNILWLGSYSGTGKDSGKHFCVFNYAIENQDGTYTAVNEFCNDDSLEAQFASKNVLETYKANIRTIDRKNYLFSFV